jgi:hypothetical protein
LDNPEEDIKMMRETSRRLAEDYIEKLNCPQSASPEQINPRGLGPKPRPLCCLVSNQIVYPSPKSVSGYKLGKTIPKEFKTR